MADSEEQTIEVRQSERDDFRVVPSTGASGGVQVSGNFQINFLLDQTKYSSTETYSVDEEGLQDLVETDDEEPYILRERQIGVSMSQNDAFGVAAWMIADLLGEGITTEDIEETIWSEYQERLE
jgi:hypothetical protein